MLDRAQPALDDDGVARLEEIFTNPPATLVAGYVCRNALDLWMDGYLYRDERRPELLLTEKGLQAIGAK